MTRRGGSRKAAGISGLAEEIERSLSHIRRALRKPLEAEVAKGELDRTSGRGDAGSRASQWHQLEGSGVRTVSLAHSTVSGIVDRLEKRGMLARRPDAADGRISRIYPTLVVKEFVREQIPALSRGPPLAALEEQRRLNEHGSPESIRRLRTLFEQE